MKFTDTKERKHYVSSDWHLNHEGPIKGTPLWESRGFSSTEDMTSGIIDTVNSIVRPNDVILYAGDFCLNTPIEQFDSLIDRINCQNIHMIFGNHNNPHYTHIYKKLIKEKEVPFKRVYPLKYKNIQYIGNYVEFLWNKQYVTFFHYPIWEWNYKLHGSWMIHGHSHYTFDPGKSSNKDNKILDVSWDGHKKPLSFEEVKEIMDTKGMLINDLHSQII